MTYLNEAEVTPGVEDNTGVFFRRMEVEGGAEGRSPGEAWAQCGDQRRAPGWVWSVEGIMAERLKVHCEGLGEFPPVTPLKLQV